jgi:hypothetical protein
MAEQPKEGFWQSLAGILTASAAIITAIGGVLATIHQCPSPPSTNHNLPTETNRSTSSKPPSVVVESKEINLLDPDNGAKVVSATSDDWQRTIGENTNLKVFGPHEEAVFSFKNNCTAVFDKIGVLIPYREPSNLKQFELLANNEPTGQFTSIGTWATKNEKEFDSPYQRFTFSPVKAKYIKIKLISNHNGYENPIEVWGFQLFGTLDQVCG